MCGIIGFFSDSLSKEKIIDSLKRLEYRGYDSAGLAIIEDKKIKRYRCKGEIKELEKKLKNIQIKANICIAHTRWATHGKPSEENAHPHTDCTGKISIVHNGIIENYLELREKLKKKGHVFKSDTDTEIFAHLIEDKLNKNLINAVESAVKEIKGNYAFAIISSLEPDKIIAVKKGAPVVIGIGFDEYFVSSDIPAFLKYTNKAIFLQDNDICVISKNGIEIKNNDKEVKRLVQNIKWDSEQAEKKGFSHFMIKEIFEQPEVFEDTILGRFNEEKGEIHIEGLDTEKLKRIKNIRLIACGTSYHAALAAKYLIEKYAGISAIAEIASEARYSEPVIEKNTLLITISQSGETADTIAAFNNIKKKVDFTIAIVNVVGSTLSRLADYVIYTHAGPEIGVASTKTFTSQMAVLYLLTFQIARIKKKMTTDLIKKYLKNLRKMPEFIIEILKSKDEIKKIADKYYEQKDFLYYGRNVNYPIALEGALKLKEISYIHAEGYPAGEIKHGPIALIDDKVPNIFVAPESRLYGKIINNIEEIKARGGKVIVITNNKNKKISKYVDDVIYIPDVDEDFYPLLAVIPMQLLAYFIGVKRGINVDKPRNLAKSVTVE